MFGKGLVKATVFRASQSALFRTILASLEKRRARTGGRLTVLTYHRVHPLDDRQDLDPALLSATPDGFRKQLEHLAEHYRVLSMTECLEAIAERDVPPGAVAITFDDAYDDFCQYAWPILRSLEIPATMFVPTAFPDSDLSFWWDRLSDALRSTNDLGPAASLLETRRREPAALLRAAKRRIKQLPHAQGMALVEQILGQLNDRGGRNAVASWSELRQMAAEGLTLAPHTRLHPILSNLPLEDALREVTTSWSDLKRWGGSDNLCPVFAYPSGAHTAALAERMPETGMTAAFTTIRGVNRIESIDPMRLLRINVGAGTPLEILRAQLVR